MSTGLKASERPCRGCGQVLPAEPSGPGRPRVFCTRRCRRDFYHRQEQAQIERERAQERERRLRATEESWYGKREAARRARWRAEKALQ